MARYLSMKRAGDALSVSLGRRGYAASGAQGVLSSGTGGSRVSILDKKISIIKEESASTAWAPDPVTGYYRPQNSNVEIDPVELRNMLLNHKPRS